MSNPQLAIAAYCYDTTRALFDGSVTIEGADATLSTAHVVTEIFERMIRGREFDVSELGWTYYLRTLDSEDPPFIALPLFPNRQFRHSAIGVTPDQCRWIIGGLDWPLAPIDFIPFLHPSDVDVTRAPEGKDLGQMLDDGEIDALISADVPHCVLADSPRVKLLFPGYERVEREYYRRTGIFPAMHTVVVRRELAAEHPELLRAVYDGFCNSREAAIDQYRHGRIFNNMDHCMVPWFPRFLDENRRLFSDGWFPYGVDANRTMVDTLPALPPRAGLVATSDNV